MKITNVLAVTAMFLSHLAAANTTFPVPLSENIVAEPDQITINTVMEPDYNGISQIIVTAPAIKGTSTPDWSAFTANGSCSELRVAEAPVTKVKIVGKYYVHAFTTVIEGQSIRVNLQPIIEQMPVSEGSWTSKFFVNNTPIRIVYNVCEADGSNKVQFIGFLKK